MSNSERTIDVIVTPDGETTVQARGFAGAFCRDATRQLQQALGEVTSERLTAEFYLSQSTEQKNHAQN